MTKWPGVEVLPSWKPRCSIEIVVVGGHTNPMSQE